MKKTALLAFIVTFGMFIQPLSIAAQSDKAPKKFQGFLGSYHPFKGTAFGGNGWTEGELIQNAFDFGENAMVSHATYNGYTFAENVENNCHNWDVNKLYGMLTPPSEHGVINQPADTDVMHPLMGKAPGMIQGAHRFSEMSKTCPQLTGVIIDDFFNDYPKALTADNLHDIKDALLGRRIDTNGNVDRKSPATTPNLKLYIVVYNHQLDRVDDTVLKYVDGVNFWVWKQTENYKNYDSYIDTIRRTFPGKDVISGVYIFNSAQTPPAKSIRYILDHAIDQYDKGKINGLLVFSAIWLSRERSTRERWNDLALPEFLGREYYPFLGEGSGRVIDAKTKKPIDRATVSVYRFAAGEPLLVARKFTDANGAFRFGAWVAKKENGRAKFEIKVAGPNGAKGDTSVTLRSGKSVKLPSIGINNGVAAAEKK